MKVIVQRVKQASVSVNQNIISQIKKGYVLLVDSIEYCEIDIKLKFLKVYSARKW